ncbi:MAG: hypothetical protein EBW49_11015, partial [Betaproteobacteria bacterium]|nr:hypothetical protein [Betaproteobacteria bacterium]
MRNMKTDLLQFRHRAMGLALLTALVPTLAPANEVDDQGRIIAGPLEADLVERGYLFYPLRVLPKNQNAPSVSNNLVRTADKTADPTAVQTAPISPNASVPAVPLAKTAAVTEVPEPPVAPKATPAPPPAQSDHANHHDHAPAAEHAAPKVLPAPASRPTASSVLVQRMEPIRPAAPAKSSDSHAADAHDADEPAKPAMSKAELAKAERAKIAQARAEKMKQEQAKAERARAERVMLADRRGHLVHDHRR